MQAQTQASSFNHDDLWQEAQALAGIQTWAIDFQKGTLELGPIQNSLAAFLPEPRNIENLSQVIHPDDLEPLLSCWEKAISGEAFEVECRLLKNREMKWFRIKSKVALDDAGKLSVVLGIAQDVTEQKQTQALVAAQRDLARIIGTVTDSTEAWPLCMNITLQASEMDSGGFYLLHETRRALELVYHQGLEAEFVKAVASYAEEAPNVQMLLAGELMYIEGYNFEQQALYLAEGLKSVAVLPIYSSGKIIGCLNVASHTRTEIPPFTRHTLETIAPEIGNIVAYLRANTSLRESEEKYRTLILSQEAAISTVDADGIFHFMNQIGAAPFGVSSNAFVGRKLHDFFPPEIADWQLAQVRQVMSTAQGQATEYQTSLAGRSSWRHVSIQPVQDAHGEVVMAMINSVDITERKQAEEALRKSQTLLTEAQRIGRMGHWEWTPGISRGQMYISEELFDLLEIPHIGNTISLEVIGQKMTPEELARVQALDHKIFSSRTEDMDYEYYIVLADGTPRWIHQKAKIEYGQDDRPRHIVGTLQDITERKLAEQALRKSESRAQAMLKAIPDLMFRLDQNGVFLDYKADVSDLHAQNFPSLIGKSNREVSPPAFADLIDEKIALTLQTGQLQTFEYQLPVPARGLRDYEARMTPSGPQEVLAIVRDITERKAADLALRASEEKYRVLIESLDNIIAMVDDEGTFLYMNDLAAHQLGGTQETLVGKKMHELFPEHVAALQMADVHKALTQDSRQVFENISMVKGQPRWYRTTIQPIHDENGRALHALINSTDIHDLKTIQEALQDLNHTLEARVEQRTAEVQDLYDNAPAGYHSLDAQGDIIRINQTHAIWLGYQQEEMIGRPITNFLTPSSQARFLAFYPDFKQRGWARDLEFDFLRKNGSLLPTLISSTAMYDDQGEYVLSRTTVYDNTERKAAEEAQRLANLEMARAMRLKDEFLANMSHELRTPLNAILAFSEGLLEQYRGPLNAHQMASVRNIETSGRHLLALINDILDLSKVEAGRLDLQMQPVALADVCEASLFFVKETATKKSLTLDFHLNDHMAWMETDPKRLKQMLVNLLTNAVKFTPPGGKVTLNVTTNPDAEQITFRVEDTGIGIPTEDLERLFQPFTQLDSSLSRQHEGTGLGLALVYRLAELHGGHIAVESTPGKGSRFTITLPFHTETLTPSASTPPAGNYPSETGSLQANPPDRLSENAIEALTLPLQKLGYSLTLHTQAESALEMVLKLRPEVILLDLLLPGSNGWEILAQLRATAQTRDIPVILLAETDEAKKGGAAGAAGFLLKPVTLEALQTTLQGLSHPPQAGTSALIILPYTAPVHILLAEDNPFNIQSTSDYLDAKGYQVTVAHNGLEALEQAPRVHPDLILMDIQMPEMDGLQTIRRLREQPEFSLTPIIALTALAMPGDRERCLQAGANEYLAKPVSLKDLAETIHLLLSHSRRA